MVVVIHGGAVTPLRATERIFYFLVVLREKKGPRRVLSREGGGRAAGEVYSLAATERQPQPVHYCLPLTMPISSAALVPSSVRCCKKGLLRSDLDTNPSEEGGNESAQMRQREMERLKIIRKALRLQPRPPATHRRGCCLAWCGADSPFRKA